MCSSQLRFTASNTSCRCVCSFSGTHSLCNNFSSSRRPNKNVLSASFVCVCIGRSYETIRQVYTAPRNKWFRVAKRIFSFSHKGQINWRYICLPQKENSCTWQQPSRVVFAVNCRWDNICIRWQVVWWLRCLCEEGQSEREKKRESCWWNL